ncbi:transporter substrate-binding domain-containing protein [Halalkalibacterium halodurans]|uniref:transporter substrate-binding domain-containing protein n=1 Tax=Halalkalibacterium halodurans TaxID=86665 RepID=UPI002AA978F2|nr:transporter substrate-binding domain-containing protein [Halalkalibacterium halodurans]MDY7224506.1 transporter substrate-binding domain-containing protein [Halalkalibacterium halodurans]MDY7243791.1 transporter substrate-binding domain-containing protein [Halalkalibacterium halodurans]
MKIKLRLFQLIIALVGLTVILNGCSSKETTADETEEKVILVGTQNDYPPFAFADENNELTGYDIEVVKEIDKKLDGYTFEFVATPWDSMFLALESNKIQAVADQIAKTPEREEKYLFTDESYFAAETVIVVKSGREDIQTLEDLEGKKVGALAGDSYTLLLEEHNEKADNDIILEYSESGNPSEILQDVQNGRVDAYVNDPIMINNVLEKYDLDVEIVGQSLVNDDMGIVFKKGEQGEELKALIDPILKELKEDGTLAELSKKWTGGEYIPE